MDKWEIHHSDNLDGYIVNKDTGMICKQVPEWQPPVGDSKLIAVIDRGTYVEVKYWNGLWSIDIRYMKPSNI